MSRSYCTYNEDWQRRKSLLIRSLFHDIPILSPVPEESNESSELIQRNDPYDVPSRPLNESPRPYSPLPHLIIEKEPNRHDDPEEHYTKLLIKIKKIYRKLFIENLDMNSEDFDFSDNTISNNDDLTESNERNNGNVNVNLMVNKEQENSRCGSVHDDTIECNNTINSNGYRADSESDDSESSYVETDPESHEDEDMTNEQELNSERIDDESNMEEESDTLRLDEECNREEPYNIRSQEINVAKESNEERIYDQDSNHVQNKHVRIDYQDQDFNAGGKSNNEEMNSTRIDDQETNDCEDSSNIKNDDQESNEMEEINNANNDELESIVNETKSKSKESVQSAPNYDNQLIISNVEAMEEDVVTTGSTEDTDYRQITTKAQVHVDGTQDTIERESRVYEDSVKSLILPTKMQKLREVRNFDIEDRIEELSVLEDKADPENTSTFNTDESDEHLEVMRTPLPKFSQESVPITRYSDSEMSSEYITRPQVLTNVTSTTEHGDDNNISELKRSNDIDEILSSIFNEKQDNNERSPLLRRKRKIYEDISVQTTDRVTWDELRENFFVGTPKIFRLCSCVDHVC